jgi:hypothetical protein
MSCWARPGSSSSNAPPASTTQLHRADGTTLALGGEREPEYTTTDVLALQTRSPDTYQLGIGAGAGVVDSDTLITALQASRSNDAS